MNQNGNPAANQIEIIAHGEGVNLNTFQSYNSIIAQIDYTPEEHNNIVVDVKAFEYSTTTTKHFNIYLRDKGINPEEVKRLAKQGGGILKTKYNRHYNIIVDDLNNN